MNGSIFKKIKRDRLADQIFFLLVIIDIVLLSVVLFGCSTKPVIKEGQEYVYFMAIEGNHRAYVSNIIAHKSPMSGRDRMRCLSYFCYEFSVDHKDIVWDKLSIVMSKPYLNFYSIEKKVEETKQNLEVLGCRVYDYYFDFSPSERRTVYE